MQIAAKDSRILIIEKSPHLEFVADAATLQGAFYQHVALAQVILRNGQIDAERLISIGVMAHRRRQSGVIKAVSGLLANLPLRGRYKLFARYFEGLYQYLSENYITAKVIFENLLPEVDGVLKARTLMALAAVIHFSATESSLPYYLQAGVIASESWCDPYTVVQVGRMIAMHKSIDGNHTGALKELENILPLVRAVGRSSPFLIVEYLNSLAYEKMELGHTEEAWRVLQIALASPFAKNYAPCRETHAELMEKRQRASRSVMAVTVAPIRGENVLCGNFPAVSPVPHRAPRSEDGKIPNIQDWKPEMVKKQEIKDKQASKETGLTKKEKQSEAIHIILDSEESDLDAILEFARNQRKGSEDVSES